MTTTDARHPLVAAYLADLERALAGADPWERADTMAAVMDHIAESLAGDPAPGDDRVRAVLDGLGPVERIAASATPALTVPAGPPTATAPGPMSQGSKVALVVIAALVALPVYPFLGVALAWVLSIGFTAPWLAVPLAVAWVAGSAIALRRTRAGGRRWLAWASLVLSGYALLSVALFARAMDPATGQGWRGAVVVTVALAALAGCVVMAVRAGRRRETWQVVAWSLVAVLLVLPLVAILGLAAFSSESAVEVGPAEVITSAP